MVPNATVPWPTRQEYPRIDFLSLLERKAWHEEARCAHHPSVDPDWFTMERSSEERGLRGWTDPERKAKACCARCVVRTACLADGLYEPFGIWGGTLASERLGWRHLPGCDKGTMAQRRDHGACVPDEQQIEFLLMDMAAQARAYGLISDEEDA